MIYIGWISTFFLAICAVPQAIDSYKNKHSNGLHKMTIACWFIGEMFGLAYVLHKWDLPLICNYGLNFASCAIIFYYRFWGKNKD